MLIILVSTKLVANNAEKQCKNLGRVEIWSF